MNLESLIQQYGAVGFLIAMFLESSIIPVPSEAVIMAAAYMGISIRDMLIFGSIGSTLGGIVGWAMGRYLGRPLLLKLGKWFHFNEASLVKIEDQTRRYQLWGVLAGRLIPVIPFKVFSIASGLVRLPLVGFAMVTFVGVVPRLFVLAYCGNILRKIPWPLVVTIAAVAVVGFFFLFFTRWRKTAAPVLEPTREAENELAETRKE